MASLEEGLKALKEAAHELSSRAENEAQTRHKLIDIVLHDILAWPRNRTSVEEHIRSGYADYVLRKSTDDPIVLIEAKRAGTYFSLPPASKKGASSEHIPVKRLCSDAAILEAVGQVRTYCINIGCEFAAITNGHEWVFFKTFEKGKKWDELNAYVIRSINYFETEFTAAQLKFSYHQIVESSSLALLLGSAPPKDRPIFFSKDRIPAYSHTIRANRLAPALRPIATRYFGVIQDNDPEFMERCYVSQRDYVDTMESMRSLIQDSLTPYFQEFGVEQLEDTQSGGRLGRRITKTLMSHSTAGEVLVLFGGKGSGKSTFIKRLLHHNPPSWLVDHAVIVIIDLLKTPEDTPTVRTAIWDALVSQLDRDGLLIGDRDRLTSVLFRDKFEVALRQDLAGLDPASEVYNLRLNQLVAEWKADKIYCAESLAWYWRTRSRGVVVVVDNTDQFSGVVQDYCFTSAQEIAVALGCVALISMREERFHNSKIHGVLDAFQNSGFHISSPRPSEVFRRRLIYARHILSLNDHRSPLAAGSDALVADCESYLSIITREFTKERSPLNGFLSACAHGDTRLALDLFRSFLLSGYTNVNEILAAGSWNFQLHQVVKPVMIPDRYFYEESLSDIPNIYQLRYHRHASHFSSLRILRKLAMAMDGSAVAYVPLSSLKAHFIETFNMLEDLEACLDLLLKHGAIEASNRLDQYSDAVDSLRITGYGLYMYKELAWAFSYLDLVCTDCGVFDESVSNYLIESAKEEYSLFVNDVRLDRVNLRLERAQKFVDYLRAEEVRERETFSLGMPNDEMFTTRLVASFEKERQRVIKSANRQESMRGWAT